MVSIVQGATMNELLSRKVYQTGELIFSTGDVAAHAYLIKRGAVRIYIGEGDQTQEIQILKTDALFGDLALISDAPRQFNAIAIKDTELILIDRAAFEEQLDSCSEFMQGWARLMSARVLDLTEQVEELLAERQAYSEGADKQTKTSASIKHR